jgi:flavin-dependent dehydrogenase
VDLDLAIVGGGPAGIATALFFAAAAPHRKGRVVVLEKERYPREKICAGAVGARADRLLETIGVRVDVPSVPVNELMVVTRQATLRERSKGVIGRIIRRIEFDHALADEARSRGLTVREGTRVTGLAFEKSRVRIETSEGPISARAVVGADGVGSYVRRAVGAPRGRWLAQVVEVDTPTLGNGESRDTLRFDLSDRSLLGYAWDFPTLVGGAPLVCRGLYELRPDPTTITGSEPDPAAPDVSARLLARLGKLGLATGVRLKRFAERGLSLHEPLARPRALLIGEAAGIDPALGEGIAQAIFYGAVAGPYLARCLDRNALMFDDWPLELRASRVGLDLRLRTAVTPWLYGSTRPLAERWVAGSRDLAIAGMRYFAGDRVPRRRLAGAALSLVEIVARAGVAAISGRTPPSS